MNITPTSASLTLWLTVLAVHKDSPSLPSSNQAGSSPNCQAPLKPANLTKLHLVGLGVEFVSPQEGRKKKLLAVGMDWPT